MTVREYIGKKLRNNVQGHLIRGKNSRYLALKSDILNNLDPSAQTADMASEAYERVYRRTGNDKALRKHMDYFFSPLRAGYFKDQLGHLVFETDPSRLTLKLTLKKAQRFARDEKDETVRAHIYSAVAGARLFGIMPDDPESAEINRRLVISHADDDIKEAEELAYSDDMQYVEPHLKTISDMYRDYNTHLDNKHLAQRRDILGKAVFEQEPTEDLLDKVLAVANEDRSLPEMSHMYVAVAAARLFNKTGKQEYMMRAKQHIDLAYAMATDATREYVAPHKTTIDSMFTEFARNNQEGVRV